jgi:uncharacterized membrane protein (DUF485 family)
MVKFNINYEELIHKIEGKEIEVVKGFVSKMARPSKIKFDKGINSSTLNWGAGLIDARLMIKNEPDNTVSFSYKKGYTTTLILYSCLALVMGFNKGWTFKEFIYFGLVVWVALPLFVSFQESYLSNKYAERLMVNLGLKEIAQNN